MDASTSLIRYDAARMALAECARIDDAADIRDKAAALAAYARQRDDNDMECWVREIHLRACVRIGELVRELDTAQGERTDLTSSQRGDEVSKSQALADAGLSKSSAHRMEQLAGGRDERAQAAGKAASENYYAQSRAKSEPPTMAGLRAAVHEAVVATVGEPPPRARPEPIEPVQPIGSAWIDFTGAVKQIAAAPSDIQALAGRTPASLRTRLLDESRAAAERLADWIAALENQHV